MRVTILATGKIADVADGFALRLIEQGKAVLSEQKKPAAKEKPAEDQPVSVPEKKAGKQKGGK